jgi:hypothetical protein
MGQREELRSVPLVQYLDNSSHCQNLSSTSGQAEFMTQYFLKKEQSISQLICIQCFTTTSTFLLLLRNFLNNWFHRSTDELGGSYSCELRGGGGEGGYNLLNFKIYA